ncbi:JAB domain-containing protein [Patiriisocius sp. Uisw_017]|uniref:JAB domain-containing protein n=1 Tax=Patiriisocius sp. Uisw_017 TaxID=3230968 RepID=UPI0039E75B12
MEVSEIKVSYTNTNKEKVRIKDSRTSYEVVLSHWDLNIIEFMEEVKVLLLDRASNVLGIYDLARGGTASCIVDIKIVLSVALKTHASSIILVHNHPTGYLVPSKADKSLTTKIKQACEYVDLVLLDHLIISKESYYSFSDEGCL